VRCSVKYLFAAIIFLTKSVASSDLRNFPDREFDQFHVKSSVKIAGKSISGMQFNFYIS